MCYTVRVMKPIATKIAGFEMMKTRRGKKKILRILRRPFEWLGVLLGLLVFTNLPRRALLAVCDVAGAVMFAFDRRGRDLSLFNLRAITGVYPPERDFRAAHGTPPTRREALILKRSYRNMARTVGHAFWTCRNARARVAVAGEMGARGKAFLAANRPAVTVSGHIGCGEILSQLAFLEGHRMMSVAKDIGTAGMTRLLMRARRSIGQQIVHADGAFRPLMRGIKDGASLGLLIDQVVRPEDGGVWVRFLGRPMPVSAAPAFFAAKGKSPVAVAWSRPLKDGRYRCEVVAAYPPEAARDVWGLTQACLRDLERVIRRHPSCWVLNYRYFRKTPKAAELEQLLAREAKAAARAPAREAAT